jgi:prepilin-type N-terminal cleavage/methylation domain-containing protein
MLKVCNFREERSFTLIELLVVTAIVGILSGLAVIGMAAAADSARVAKAKNFAHGIDENLGLSNIGKWNFNSVVSSVAQDSSGKGNDAVLEGNATTTGDTPAGVGPGEKAIVFDGYYASRLNVGDRPSLKPTEKITISLWFKAFEYNQNYAYSTLVSSKSNSSSPWPGYLLGVYFDGRLMGKIRIGSDDVYLYGTTQVSLDKWHHAAFTFDGSMLRMYLDGKKEGENPASGLIVYYSGPNDIFIGNDPAVGGKEFKGIIDNVQIYADSFQGQ